jgi:sortase A
MKRYLISIGFILFGILTLSVLVYPFISDYHNSRIQSRSVTHYFDDVATMKEQSRREMLKAARDFNTRLMEKDGRFRFTEEDTAEYKSLLDTGRGIMGILTIDSIDVNLPIYHGTDEAILQIGIGHMEGTSLPVGGKGTHTFITGHRGLPTSKLLSELNLMETGDSFTLHVLGERMTYRVDEIKTVTPFEVRSLDIDPEGEYCTLVTCTPYGVNTHRLLVRGHRVDSGSAGKLTIYSGAIPLEKTLIILLFIIPILPVVLIILIIKCLKLYRKGRIRR